MQRKNHRTRGVKENLLIALNLLESYGDVPFSLKKWIGLPSYAEGKSKSPYYPSDKLDSPPTRRGSIRGKYRGAVSLNHEKL